MRVDFRTVWSFGASTMLALLLAGCPEERGRVVLLPGPQPEPLPMGDAVCLRLVNARSGAAEVRLERSGQGLAAAYGASSPRVCTTGELSLAVSDAAGADLGEVTLPETGEVLVVVGDGAEGTSSPVQQVTLDAAEGTGPELQLLRASAAAASLNARLRDTSAPSTEAGDTESRDTVPSEREISEGWQVVSSQPSLILGDDFHFSLTLAERPGRYVFVALGDPERSPGRTGPSDAGLFGILLGPPLPIAAGSADIDAFAPPLTADDSPALTVLQDPLLYVAHGLVDGPGLDVRVAGSVVRDLEFGQVAGPWPLSAAGAELLIGSGPEQVFIDTRTPSARSGERLVAILSGSVEADAQAAPELLFFNEGLSLAARDLPRSRVLHAAKPEAVDAVLLESVDVVLGEDEAGPYFARVGFAEGSQPEDGLPTEGAIPQPYRVLSSDSLESIAVGTLPALPPRALLMLLGSRAPDTVTPFGIYPLEVRANGTLMAMRPLNLGDSR